jgi:hypothetical protein
MEELRQYNALVFIGREFVGINLSELTRCERNILRHVNTALRGRFKSREEGTIYDSETQCGGGISIEQTM